MRSVGAILRSAEELAPVLGFDWPISAALQASPASDNGATPSTDLEGRLAALEKQIEHLSNEVYDRVKGAMFDAETLRTSEHIAQLWQAVGDLPPQSALSAVELVWRDQSGPVLQRTADFALSLLAAAGLDRFEDWTSKYWQGKIELARLAWKQRTDLRAIVLAGEIDLVRDLDLMSDEGFVRTCFHCILGRPVDDDGLNNFCDALRTDWSRLDVFNAVIGSDEASARARLGAALPRRRDERNDGAPNYLASLCVVLNRSLA